MAKDTGDLQAAFDSFWKGAEEILHELTQPINEGPTPNPLYHYTDEAGLYGILKTGSLWLTDIYSLNDPSEFRHGVKKGLEHIKRVARQKSAGSAATLGEQFSRHLNANLETTAHYFVCSFSKTKDDIGQWRAYADDGRGYALVFDGPVIDAAFMNSKSPDQGPMHATFSTIYDDKHLENVLGRLADAAVPFLDAIPHDETQKEFSDRQFKALQELATKIFTASIIFKHPAYDSEEEFRFMQMYGPETPCAPETRKRPYSLVKYFQFNWKQHAPAALKGIIIGPAADPTVAHKFAQDCLTEGNVEGVVHIERSDIPYRRTRS